MNLAVPFDLAVRRELVEKNIDEQDQQWCRHMPPSKARFHCLPMRASALAGLCNEPKVGAAHRVCWGSRVEPRKAGIRALRYRVELPSPLATFRCDCPCIYGQVHRAAGLASL